MTEEGKGGERVWKCTRETRAGQRPWRTLRRVALHAGGLPVAAPCSTEWPCSSGPGTGRPSVGQGAEAGEEGALTPAPGGDGAGTARSGRPRGGAAHAVTLAARSSSLISSFVARSIALLPSMSCQSGGAGRAGAEQQARVGRMRRQHTSGSRGLLCALHVHGCRHAAAHHRPRRLAGWGRARRSSRREARGEAHLDVGVGARLEHLVHLAVVALAARHEQQQVAGVRAAGQHRLAAVVVALWVGMGRRRRVRPCEEHASAARHEPRLSAARARRPRTAPSTHLAGQHAHVHEVVLHVAGQEVVARHALEVLCGWAGQKAKERSV